jgi:UDP-2,3-diacylglucosamine hydrolase
MTIKENAIFIADVHYPHHDNGKLEKLLLDIKSHKIQTSQIFFMGDIFDLLFGYNSYIKTFSSKAITLIDELSKEFEIYYLEGNHDFCLKEIFTNIKVIPYSQQPYYLTYHNQKVALSHGDKFDTPLSYKIYSTILRNPLTLMILKPFEKMIIDYRISKLSQKSICKEFVGFKKKVSHILKYYQDVDMVIEGHFHQAKQLDKYISLPSLACQNQIGIAQNGTINFISI